MWIVQRLQCFKDEKTIKVDIAVALSIDVLKSIYWES